ncbi:MAG: DUF4276 family protein [Methylobacter sp.]|nr:DUF4276 family protein [Methylobacter sp.]MDP2099331.1 DUF4276 family protein [Methylobacter sp.]MDP2427267.1 DUF4276 family protein [Methylobacter sp.]MDP3054846.1 DUF4276 family protein [Methylobacter sp.]MDP3363828.1 DUF4276 family protein [Methylobacter sp.]
MVRLGISVEGTTEERFIKAVLVPYLAQKGIYVTPVSINGNVSVDRVKHELENLAYSFDYVSTFYDFYGFKRKVEGETKTTLESKIKESVKEGLRENLIPYIQMYEFEGLLFSSPETIAAVLQDESLNAWATDILVAFNHNPEKVNDSPETAPSKRLEKSTNYRKTTHGPNIAKQIGLAKMRDMCSGFDGWLTKLEGLVS